MAGEARHALRDRVRAQAPTRADTYVLLSFHVAAENDASGMGSMMQDLAFAIPGIDEAMGFAEVMSAPHPRPCPALVIPG